MAVTVAYSVALWRTPDRRLRPGEVVGEVAVGAALSLADGGVWDADHSQSLGSAWPLAGVLSAGVVGGAVAGMAAGAVIGLARFGAQFVDASVNWGEDELVSAASTLMLYVLAGGICGYAATRLRKADRRLSLATARDEVAVDLHDGVLQTLAVVQRRSDDPAWSRWPATRSVASGTTSSAPPTRTGPSRPALRDVATELRAGPRRAHRRRPRRGSPGPGPPTTPRPSSAPCRRRWPTPASTPAPRRSRSTPNRPTITGCSAR